MSPPDWSRRAATDVATTNLKSPNNALISIYDALYIIGVPCLLLVLIILAWLSAKNKRKDLCSLTVFSWLVEAVAHLLLLGQQMGARPNTNLCLVQAMAIYGSPAFAGLTCAAYMIQIYYTLLPTSSFHRYRIWTILLHMIPVTIFLAIMLEVFIVGKVLHPESIQRDPSGMYCNLDTQNATLAVILSDGFAILALLTILTFEGLAFRHIRRMSNESSPEMKANVALVRNILKRVMIFSLWAGVCFGLYVLYAIPSANSINAEIQVVWATLPLVAALVFGTQKDIINASRFWRKRGSDELV